MLRSAGGTWFVRCTEVVRFSECPLSEVPLYTIIGDVIGGLSSKYQCARDHYVIFSSYLPGK